MLRLAPLLALALSLLVGCSCDPPAGEGNGEGEACATVLDCAAGLYCNRGTCSSEAPPEMDAGGAPRDGGGRDAGDAPRDAGDRDAGDRDAGVGADGGGGLDGGSGGTERCLFRPTPGPFAPEMECAWRGSAVEPNRNDVVATPVVANLTDDNGDGRVDTDDVPDIAFISYDLEGGGCCRQPGAIRVVSGRCGADGLLEEHFSITSPRVDNSAGLAVADIDADGFPEIVAGRSPEGTVAFNHDGTLLWESPYPTRAEIGAGDFAVQPSLADLDGDGIGEIIVGHDILDGLTGARLSRGGFGHGYNGFLGPISFAGDVNLDGFAEIIAGDTVYRSDGEPLCTMSLRGSVGQLEDGYNAVGNFDADPEGEIVVVREGYVYLVDTDCSLIDEVRIPVTPGYAGANEGGPPTIADFDGDGLPEIGVAGARYYIVVDFNDCGAAPLPAFCFSDRVRWAQPNDDDSSRVTGSSVFDFEGDGAAEVVYNDEQFFRVFDGATGAIKLEVRNCSHTRLEYPLVADVDDDGNAEIVFIENGSGCSGMSVDGIQVWGDPSDGWVPTRRIWSQHAYYISNVTESGQLTSPRTEPSWLSHNTFRQNLPDFDVFAAPDVVVEPVGMDQSACPATLTLTVRVCNEGELRVGAGLPVALRESDGTVVCTASTSRTIAPGSCEELRCTITDPPVMPDTRSYTICGDDAGEAGPGCASPGTANECREENNSAMTEEVTCTDIV